MVSKNNQYLKDTKQGTKVESYSIQIVDKTTKISMNILMFWSFFKKNKPYD